jgi:N,N'-diacetyllegionaminate synthase
MEVNSIFKKKNKKTFIIAEVGLAHEGSLGLAMKYVDIVKSIGADCVKFQTHLAEYESSKFEKFRVNVFPQDKTRYDYWKRTSFTFKEWFKLKKYCDKKKIEFLSSPFSIEAIKLLRRCNIKFWKLSSGESYNRHILNEICKDKKPVIFSTGLSSIREVEKTAKILKKNKKNFAILHCTSRYPTKPEEIGLNIIEKFKKKFFAPIGFSDHSGKIYSSLAAVTLGASIIENHIILSKDSFGPDTSSSLDVEEFKKLVEGVRFIEKIKENPISKEYLDHKTQKLKKLFGKSAFIKKKIKKYEILKRNNIVFKKPGSGLNENQIQKFIGKKLNIDLKPGELIKKFFFI